MTDIKALVTRLAKDKGYSGEPPTASGMKGFVCPRADAYGGRDGIIPPGIAAQYGLIPSGMRKVSVADTAKTANAAIEESKTEEERYWEYYGRNAEVLDPEIDDGVPGGLEEGLAEVAMALAPVVEPQRMFSPPVVAVDAGDTLDDFYDGLKGLGFGTEGAPRVQRKQASVRIPGGQLHMEQVQMVSAPQPRVAPVQADHGRALANALDQISQLQAERSSLLDEVEKLKERIRGMRPPKGETVRVVLSAPEQKIKLGGESWECKIMGAVHYSRTRDTLVLTVSDPSYASELLAEMVPGDLVMVTGDGRTSCTYGGQCAKIYGESGDSDFIACFTMSCGSE